MVGGSQDATFCFTDIEDSTGLMRSLGESRFEATLERHREIIRSALADQAGREVKTEGDGFLLVFEDPSAAAAFAVEAQRRLATEAWGHSPVRVRMGMHRGPAQPRPDGDYVALALHQAARVVRAAHGGQVVMTRAAVAGAQLPPAVRLERLGRYRLRDFEEPVELLQVVGPSLGRAFPPLRAGRADVGLPLPRSAMVGRDRELDLLRGLLETVPLITLVGPGGVGKTRLALEAAVIGAGGFPDGVHMVELSSVASDDLVASTATAVVGVRPTAGQSPLEALVGEIGQGRHLLIFDSSERVLSGVANTLLEIGRACPHAVVMVTSTEPVRVPDERVVPVGPLQLPEEGAAPEEFVVADAVRLLLQRANAAGAELGEGVDVAGELARVARTLDGIPLALELAAGRIGELGLEQVIAGLDDRFSLLTNGMRTALPRHQTLEAAVAWTFELLEPADRALLGLLSALAGRWPVDDAIAVCGAPPQARSTVERLVARALIITGQEEPPRLRLLDTIRAFGARSQDRDEGFEDRLLDALIRRVSALRDAPELVAQEELEALLPDIRRATAEPDPRRLERATELATLASVWWESQGLWREGIERLTPLHARCPPGPTRHLCAAAISSLHRLMGHGTEAATWAEAVVAAPDAPAYARALALLVLNWLGGPVSVAGDDAIDEAYRLTQDHPLMNLAIRSARAARLASGNPGRAVDEMAEIVAEAVARGRPTLAAQALLNRGTLLSRLGDLDGAEQDLARGRELASETGSAGLLGTALAALAGLALRRGEFTRAIDLAEQRIALARKMGDQRGESHALTTVAAAAIAMGDLGRARPASVEALEIFRSSGEVEGAIITAFNLIVLSSRGGDLADAAAWSQVAIDDAAASGNVMLEAMALLGAGAVACLTRDADGPVLLAAGEARSPAMMPLDSADREWLAQAAGVARAAMGDAAYDAGRSKGAALDASEALAIARRAVRRGAAAIAGR